MQFPIKCKKIAVFVCRTKIMEMMNSYKLQFKQINYVILIATLTLLEINETETAN